MTRFTKTTLFSLFGLGFLCLGTADLQACPRSGGGYYRSAPSYSNYHRPVYQNYSQPVVRRTSAIQQPASQPPQQQPPQQNFEQQAPQAPSQMVQNPQQAPAQTTPANNAQMSALQMLANFSGEATQQASTPVSPQGFNGIGIWTATLPNNAVVKLEMKADGNFTWTALSKGKQSTFQGSYNLTDSNLTLNRSNDNQKLDGSLTINGDSFVFKITGTNDSGLKFTRS